jgi:hypothetical protein
MQQNKKTKYHTVDTPVPTSIRTIPATAKSTPNAQIHNHIHFPGLSQAHQSKVAGLYCYLVL